MRLLAIYMVLCMSVFLHVQQLQANNTVESTKRLLILGDSLTAGYGLMEEEAFPMQLQKALQRAGHNVKVINAGVSGDTTAGGLARLEWALADVPHLVLIELGGNDALRGLPPEETFTNLDAILGRLKEAGVPVILAGMQAPRNLGEDYVTAFNQVYQRLAGKYEVSFYPFFLEGVVQKQSLNQADGIHPNASGVAIIVDRILPTVELSLRSIP
jgi:acyl-CoA thioesterase-1